MINSFTMWYTNTWCTMSGSCQSHFFYVLLCQGLHGSYETCDTSLFLFFKEGSHSSCLSSVPLAEYISSNGEFGTIQLIGCVSVWTMCQSMTPVSGIRVKAV